MLIGILIYYATGEGKRVYIISGDTKEDILKNVDPYFQKGFDFYNVKELREYIQSGEVNESPYKTAKELIRHHTPAFYEVFCRSSCSVNYHMHFNLG